MDQFNQYYLFADESIQDGELYSNFYGGALIPQSEYEPVRTRLLKKKQELGFEKSELKWQKVTPLHLESYKNFISAFFHEMAHGKVKMRVFFRSNKNEYRGEVASKDRYLRLYYQFLKHSFGFSYRPTIVTPFRLRLFLDKLPDKKEKVKEFKNYLCQLGKTQDTRGSGVIIEPEMISEIDSKDYVLLQCVDIVLGAMAFRLNNIHLKKPLNARTRGKRTMAKEKLYKHIWAEISALYRKKGVYNYDPKNGEHYKNYPYDRWTDAYRHWQFKPVNK